MTLAEELHQSASACTSAAVALAHSLRPSATQNQNAATTVRDTYHEAEAFAITCRAVMDEIAPILPLLEDNASIVGKSPPVTTSRVKNGFDSLVLILLTLFDTANNAILEVAGNHSRWLVSPLQATAAFERMVMHHGQLRAMYGIIHLAAKIVRRAKVSDTLFVDVNGTGSERDLEPARWRAAIKMDDFYGRCFGFHYSPEMRNVLRVVNIARGSVHKSHTEDDPTPQLIKNVVMLGWGWIYSNMVIINNLGLSIDGVSRIGADGDHQMSIQELRKFMNLVEEPLVAGVSGLASPDVAVDDLLQIPQPGSPGSPDIADDEVDSKLRAKLFASIKAPVSVRIMSYKNRPINLCEKRGTKSSQPRQGGGTVFAEKFDNFKKENSSTLRCDQEVNVSDNATAPCFELNHEERHVDREGMVRSVWSEPHSADAQKAPSQPVTNQQAQKGLSGVTDRSYLASTIKSELIKLQSNVSQFLGLEEAKPARGLIVHFHGGGFVSQSTTSHQAYMKEWCADVPDAVLFSVDYKLAPEHKFPTAIHECAYAYAWALQNATRLGTYAERVVFTGDSAGGNLAVATALLVTELGLRSPDGICVGYPALYVKVAWSPSRLLSFFDPMLPLSVMELCVKSYLPDDEDEAFDNPLLSPVAASADQLRKLPRVTIVCGSLDPLLDDSVLFAHRLRQAGRNEDVLQIYDSMPHGFLNMSQVNVTARKGMRFLAKMIAEYSNLPLRQDNLATIQENEETHCQETSCKAAVSRF